MKEIEVLPPFIKLEQFLKLADIAETGGMAKMMRGMKGMMPPGFPGR